MLHILIFNSRNFLGYVSSTSSGYLRNLQTSIILNSYHIPGTAFFFFYLFIINTVQYLQKLEGGELLYVISVTNEPVIYICFSQVDILVMLTGWTASKRDMRRHLVSSGDTSQLYAQEAGETANKI